MTYLEMLRGGRSGKFKKVPCNDPISYKMTLVELRLANRRETARRGGSEYEVKQKMFEVYIRTNVYAK